MREANEPAGEIVAVLYGRLLPDAGPDDLDILEETAFISSALTRLGYTPVRFETGLDTAELESELTKLRPALVFNLVDAIDGCEEHVTVAPDMLERLGLAYTGVSARGIRLASNKPAAKKIMEHAGIPTPKAVTGTVHSLTFEDASGKSRAYIIKPASGSASDGIDDEAVLRSSRDVAHINAWRWNQLACGNAYIEHFVEGREVAGALLEGPEGPQVLPPSEMLFLGYSPEKPKIVGYAAKWLSDSFEYCNTQRRLRFPAEDQPLLRRLSDIAVECWNNFHLGGYARIDFRVDLQSRPWVVDINPNPCLSEDGGFVAAATEAGLTSTDVVRRIVSYPVVSLGEKAAGRPGFYEEGPHA